MKAASVEMEWRRLRSVRGVRERVAVIWVMGLERGEKRRWAVGEVWGVEGERGLGFACAFGLVGKEF